MISQITYRSFELFLVITCVKIATALLSQIPDICLIIPEVRILGAEQKERGLWGRDCLKTLLKSPMLLPWQRSVHLCSVHLWEIITLMLS